MIKSYQFRRDSPKNGKFLFGIDIALWLDSKQIYNFLTIPDRKEAAFHLSSVETIYAIIDANTYFKEDIIL